MGVDEALAAGYDGKVERRLRGGGEAADMGYHDLGVEETAGDPVDGVGHVLHVAAGVGDDMVHHVVDVVEVEHGGELLVGGAGKEVEASAEGEQVGALRDERRDGGEEEDVVVAAAGRRRVRGVGLVHEVVGLEQSNRVGDVARIDEVQVDAVQGAVGAAVGVGEAEDLRRAGEAGVINVRDNEAPRTLFGAVACDVDAAEAHCAAPGEEEHGSAVGDAHVVGVRVEGVVVVGAEGRDDARNRLGKGALEEGIAVIREQAAHLDDDGRNVDVRRFAAVGMPGVAHRLQLVAGDVEGGLDADALARVELGAPLRADLADDSRDFMSGNDGVLRDVVGDALVSCAEGNGLVVAHADRVGHDFDDDAVLAGFLQFDVLESGVLGAVQSPCLSIHCATILAHRRAEGKMRR